MILFGAHQENIDFYGPFFVHSIAKKTSFSVIVVAEQIDKNVLHNAFLLSLLFFLSLFLFSSQMDKNHARKVFSPLLVTKDYIEMNVVLLKPLLTPSKSQKSLYIQVHIRSSNCAVASPIYCCCMCLKYIFIIITQLYIYRGYAMSEMYQSENHTHALIRRHFYCYRLHKGIQFEQKQKIKCLDDSLVASRHDSSKNFD